MTIGVTALDHLVLTVADIDRTVDFYTRVLGLREETFGAGRKALRFGTQKFNLHQTGREFEPKAEVPTPASIDLCLICEMPVDAIAKHLTSLGVPVLEGPVERTGATGKIRSVYIRDPDLNLIELANYL